jgi:hypothetical protein
MATIGTMTDYLENKLINHLLLNTNYSSPAAAYLALYTATPSDIRTGTEVISTVSASSYTRQNISGNMTVSGSYAYNSTKITFPEAMSDWGTILGVGIMDAATSGCILFWGKMNNTITINTGEVFSINPGMLSIGLSGGTKGGWGDGIPQQILNHVLKNTPMSSPGTNVYVALGNGLTYGNGYEFTGWTETSATGYSRKKVTSWYSPTAGSTCNLAEVLFSNPPISVVWGSITNIVIFNASSSGDALLWGKLRSPVYIIDGDGFKFAPGDIDITFN